jgi:hypothetical protein
MALTLFTIDVITSAHHTMSCHRIFEADGALLNGFPVPWALTTAIDI